MADIAVDVTGSDDHPILHMLFPVAYRSFYLYDTSPQHQDPFGSGIHGRTDARLVTTARGSASFTTGLADGRIDLTIEISRTEPPAHLDDFEDIIEASLEVATNKVTLEAWAGMASVPLPELPGGPGSYRLRYHARGMDEAYDDFSDTPIDLFLLQIWPAPTSEPTYLKLTSTTART